MYQFSHPLNAPLNAPRGVFRIDNPFDKTVAPVFIPLIMDNTDCLQFLVEWKNGALILDITGSIVAYSDAEVVNLGLEPVG